MSNTPSALFWISKKTRELLRSTNAFKKDFLSLELYIYIIVGYIMSLTTFVSNIKTILLLQELTASMKSYLLLFYQMSELYFINNMI